MINHTQSGIAVQTKFKTQSRDGLTRDVMKKKEAAREHARVGRGHEDLLL
jgi:hypothetical protein